MKGGGVGLISFGGWNAHADPPLAPPYKGRGRNIGVLT